MKIEFSPFGVGGPLWNRPFPALELKSPDPELTQFGRAKVERIDNFPELDGKKGALLVWPYFEKKGYKWIIDIGKSKEYIKGVDVQILRTARPDEDALYYARVMEKGSKQWGPKELFPPTDKLLKFLNPAYHFEIKKT